MTPVEKIIMWFYAANTFMFNPEDEMFYSPNERNKVLFDIKKAIMQEQSIDLSEEQIKMKYKYLRDIFVKTNKLVEAKENITYMQKCVYQRMFFLKPFICANKKSEKSSTVVSYDLKQQVKTNQSESNACNQEIQNYFNNVKRKVSNDMVKILNGIIITCPDPRSQRQIFYVILKAIRHFRERSL